MVNVALVNVHEDGHFYHAAEKRNDWLAANGFGGSRDVVGRQIKQ